MKRLQAPSPVYLIAVAALFFALGGGAAWASGLISGKQIVDHSIPARKLTRGAIKSLRGMPGPAGPRGARGAPGSPGATGAPGPQGPGAISFDLGDVPEDSAEHFLASSNGIDAYYECTGANVAVQLAPHVSLVDEFLSGDRATNGTLSSLQETTDSIDGAYASSTANLDVVAWAANVGKLSRFDLGGFHGAGGCNIWGLITPGS
jgi:hypothetical protein